MVASYGDLLDVQRELGDLITELAGRVDSLEKKIRAVIDDLAQHEIETAEPETVSGSSSE